MTISPPAKVNSYDENEVRILSSNFDKLDLSIYILWVNDEFFQYLEKMKTSASRCKKDISISLSPLNGKDEWKCMIKPHGANGYAWLLTSKDFVFKIGNWLEPHDRPSAFVEVHSEALWRLGAEKCIEQIINILKGQGGGALIESIKPSRVDLCVDIIIPDKIWSDELIKYKVTRASTSAQYYYFDKVKGISIGKGNISARLYDKPLEIKQQSKKYWMYDVWGINKNDLDDNHKIIRVEFQLRRELIKKLRANYFEDLLKRYGKIWAYCTQNWLKFQDRPGKHHNQRKTFKWWQIVQNGFGNIYDGNPIIRERAMNFEIEQCCNQIFGLLTSMEAANMEFWNPEGTLQPVRSIALQSFCRTCNAMGKDSFYFMDEINNKRAKYKRIKAKTLQGHKQAVDIYSPKEIETSEKHHQKSIFEED